MNREQLIHQRLSEGFNPVYLEIENESHKHSGHGSETHFRVLLASEDFQGLSRVDRQRKVYQLFEDQFKAGLHAFSLRALTPEEWNQQKAQFPMVSPDCKGGSK
jgi:stress-induced morphogen